VVKITKKKALLDFLKTGPRQKMAQKSNIVGGLDPIGKAVALSTRGGSALGGKTAGLLPLGVRIPCPPPY